VFDPRLGVTAVSQPVVDGVEVLIPVR
jgi:hypothetical protein